MLESKIWEKAEQKSKVFLRQVMGDDIFDKFIRDGKIEIKSEYVTYELYENGNVVNITTNQKYCIVPNRSDYPSYDVIAIKFAWLKYGQKTVDRVANRTNLETTRHDIDISRRQQENIPSYLEFIHYMESRGLAREQVTLDERNTHIVAISSIERGFTGSAIDIRCPAGRNITIMGINQVPRDMDVRFAHSVVLRIADENDVEISGDTAIAIYKIRPSDSIRLLAQGPYSLFNLTRQIDDETFWTRVYKTCDEWYRWRSGVLLMDNDILSVNIINSPININRKSIKMSIDMDLWVMHV